MELSASKPPPKEKYSYYQSGQMVFLISHQGDELIDTPIDPLIEWGNKLAERLNLKIMRCHERELHFPGTLERTISTKQEMASFSRISYSSPKPQPRGAFSLIPVEVRGEIDPETNPEGTVDASKLIELVIKLDDARKDEALIQAGITLDVVSPNWLASPCSEMGGGGGHPPPVPYTSPNNTVAYKHSLPTEIESLYPQDEVGKGITVAILDTAPSLHDLAEAYERHHKVRPHDPKDHHPILEGLLGPNGRLQVHAAALDELLRLRSVHLRDHDRNMTDHGLFIAGIVNSVAPNAEIHLYEVFNADGVADIESIARGFWKVIADQKGEEARLLVNCSFVINIPRLNHRITDLDPKLLAKIMRKWDKENTIDFLTSEHLSRDGETWLARQGLAIEWICDLIYALGSRVIAAARNDWDNQESTADLPVVRYPAAFGSTIGVGLLPTGKITMQADQPESIEVMALGGEIEENSGVLGVYIGNFPPDPVTEQIKMAGTHKKSDWAWWAGTSFTTPILTGAIAAVLSGPAQPATTEDAIVSIYTAGAIEENKTLYEEDLLAVTQG